MIHPQVKGLRRSFPVIAAARCFGPGTRTDSRERVSRVLLLTPCHHSGSMEDGDALFKYKGAKSRPEGRERKGMTGTRCLVTLGAAGSETNWGLEGKTY